MDQEGRHVTRSQLSLVVRGALVAVNVLVAITYLDLYSQSFGGGQFTRPLLNFYFCGIVASALSLIDLGAWRRSRALLVTVGLVLSSPLYLYFLAPGVFQQLVPGPWLHTDPLWTWDAAASLGLVSMAITWALAMGREAKR